MSGTRGSQQAQKLAEGVGKLHAEEPEEGQHDEENNAANKLGIPMNLAGCLTRSQETSFFERPRRQQLARAYAAGLH